jgi:hypothetical protein
LGVGMDAPFSHRIPLVQCNRLFGGDGIVDHFFFFDAPN